MLVERKAIDQFKYSHFVCLPVYHIINIMRALQCVCVRGFARGGGGIPGSKLLSLAMEMDKERKSRLEKMVATAQLMLALTKGVVNVGVVLSLNPT